MVGSWLTPNAARTEFLREVLDELITVLWDDDDDLVVLVRLRSLVGIFFVPTLSCGAFV
jgi:hypothetical protein